MYTDSARYLYEVDGGGALGGVAHQTQRKEVVEIG